MAYVADVVGIALGLEELRHIRIQRVLLMDLLQTLLVEDLQGEKAIRVGITCVVLQSKERLLPAELAMRVTINSHHSSEAGSLWPAS